MADICDEADPVQQIRAKIRAVELWPRGSEPDTMTLMSTTIEILNTPSLTRTEYMRGLCRQMETSSASTSASNPLLRTLFASHYGLSLYSIPESKEYVALSYHWGPATDRPPKELKLCPKFAAWWSDVERRNFGQKNAEAEDVTFPSPLFEAASMYLSLLLGSPPQIPKSASPARSELDVGSIAALSFTELAILGVQKRLMTSSALADIEESASRAADLAPWRLRYESPCPSESDAEDWETSMSCSTEAALDDIPEMTFSCTYSPGSDGDLAPLKFDGPSLLYDMADPLRISKDIGDLDSWASTRDYTFPPNLIFEQGNRPEGIPERLVWTSEDLPTKQSTNSGSEGEFSFICDDHQLDHERALRKDLVSTTLQCVSDLAHTILRTCLLYSTQSSINQFAPSGSSTSTASSRHSEARTPPTSNTTSVQKRSHQPDNDDREEGNDHGRRREPSSKRSHCDQTPSPRLLACPYSKFDPRRYSQHNAQDIETAEAVACVIFPGSESICTEFMLCRNTTVCVAARCSPIPSNRISMQDKAPRASSEQSLSSKKE